MIMNILVTGVQNAIEESIVKLAVERIEGKAKFRVLSFSDFMDSGESPAEEFKLLKETQDKIKQKIQMKVLEGKGGHMIIDGYFTVKSKLGFVPVMTGDLLNIIKPDFLVHIDVDPLALGSRLENRKEFDEHQEIEKSCALYLGANAGCGIRIIKSGPEGARDAADELYGMLKELLVKK